MSRRSKLPAAVAEESNGTVKIVNYFGGQLGGEAEIVQQVARGRLDGGGVGLGTLSLVAPEMAAVHLIWGRGTPSGCSRTCGTRSTRN